MNNEKTKPRNVGPGPRVAEKPKDLKTAVKKLVHYLNKLNKYSLTKGYINALYPIKFGWISS